VSLNGKSRSVKKQQNPARYDVNSLKRALRILELLAEEGKALGVTELGRRLSLDKSMVHRLLATLSGSGYVEQDPETRKYALGLKIVELAGLKLNSIQMRSVLKPVLKELVAQTGESAHLAVLVDREIIYLDKEEGTSVLTVRGGVGLRCPPHSSAVGKVLLAYLSDEVVTEILRKSGLPRFTERTIVSLSALKTQLADVRQQGFGIDDEETFLGVRCLAAPVRDHRGAVVASIGLSGPVQQVSQDRLGLLIDLLKDVAARASAKLGCPASPPVRRSAMTSIEFRWDEHV